MCVLSPDIPATPTNVQISEVTCTSALVSWDEPADASGIVDYNIEWGLLDDQGNTRSKDVSGQHHFELRNLQPSNDYMNDYVVSVSIVVDGVKGNSSNATFSTRSNGKCSISTNLHIAYMYTSYNL